LSPQLQLPLHRLDDEADFRQMLQYESDLNRVTDPQRYAQWQALRRHLVQEAVTLPPPHIMALRQGSCNAGQATELGLLNL
jgi:hypothetical protein